MTDLRKAAQELADEMDAPARTDGSTPMRLRIKVDALRAALAADVVSAPKPDCGHGHVYPRADGMKARCGGPLMCRACATDADMKALLGATP